MFSMPSIGKPNALEKRQGKYLCRVCGDIANGIHFGVHTCEGCKKFFRRCLLENSTLICKARKACRIDIKTRNTCRLCRYLKCLEVGMSRSAIRMGRPRNNTLTSIPEKQESKTNGENPPMVNCTPDIVPQNEHRNFCLTEPIESETVNWNVVPTYTEADFSPGFQPSVRSRSLGNIHYCMSRNYQCSWNMPQRSHFTPIKIHPWNDIEGNRTLLYKSPDFSSMPDLRLFANHQPMSMTSSSDNNVQQHTNSFNYSFSAHRSKFPPISRSYDNKISQVPKYFLDFTDQPIAENNYAMISTTETTLSPDILTRNVPDQHIMRQDLLQNSDSFPCQTSHCSQLSTSDFDQWLTSSQSQCSKREMPSFSCSVDQTSSCTENIDWNSDLFSWAL